MPTREWLILGGPRHGKLIEAQGYETIELAEADALALDDPLNPNPSPEITLSLHAYRLREFAKTEQHPCVPGAAGWITTYRCYVHTGVDPADPEIVATVARYNRPDRAPTYQDPWTLPTPAWKLRRERNENAPGHVLFHGHGPRNRLAELFRPPRDVWDTLANLWLDGHLSDRDLTLRTYCGVPECSPTCPRPRNHPGAHLPDDTPEDTP